MVLNQDVKRGCAFQGHPVVFTGLTVPIPTFAHELLSTRLGARDVLHLLDLLSLPGVSLLLVNQPGFRLPETSMKPLWPLPSLG